MIPTKIVISNFWKHNENCKISILIKELGNLLSNMTGFIISVYFYHPKSIGYTGTLLASKLLSEKLNFIPLVDSMQNNLDYYEKFQQIKIRLEISLPSNI